MDHKGRAVELLTYYVRNLWDTTHPDSPIREPEERDLSDIVEHIILAVEERIAGAIQAHVEQALHYSDGGRNE